MDLRIRERREALGLTQTELAKKVGKSFRTIQSWERGESYPNAEYVSILCNVFGTDPNSLLDWYATHPCAHPQAQDPEHAELVGCYDQCTDDRKDSLMRQARDAAFMSREFSECAVPSAKEE